MGLVVGRCKDLIARFQRHHKSQFLQKWQVNLLGNIQSSGVATNVIISVFRITTLYLLGRNQRKATAVPPHYFPGTGSPGSDMYV